MQRTPSNWLLLIACLALCAGWESTARAGYICDVTQMGELIDLSDSSAATSYSPNIEDSSAPVDHHETASWLFQVDGPGNVGTGAGVGTPSVGGSSVHVSTPGLLLPVETPEIQLRSWLAAAATVSRAPPHLDRLFRPPRSV